ncbi:hypothetical protein Bca4012_074801 [Brassica carinata]
MHHRVRCSEGTLSFKRIRACQALVRFFACIELNHMLHRLRAPTIPLSFILANAFPKRILNALATASHGRHAQRLQSAFAVGVLSDLYAFHRSTEIPLPLPHSSLVVSPPSVVEPRDLTADLKATYDALRPIIPDNASILSDTRCWHRVSRCLFPIPPLLLLGKRSSGPVGLLPPRGIAHKAAIAENSHRCLP